MAEPDKEPTMADEPMTPAEHILVAALCQFHNPFPGPKTWLCRYAWLTYYQRQPLDVDQLIAEHADWLNRPENANTRADIVNTVDYLRQLAAKPPLWPVPDNAFDPDQWSIPNDGKTPHNPRWTLSGPGRFEIQHDQGEGWYDAGTFEPGHEPTLTAYTYLPRDPEPEPPRQPAKWDGRPIPGKCTIDDCPNQATSMFGYWDGGAPGRGTWRQQGRCPQHETGHELAELRTELEP